MKQREGMHYNMGDLEKQTQLMYSIDDLINKKCKKKRVTKESFFKNCEISYSTYRNYFGETDVPAVTFFTVKTLADALEVGIDELCQNL